MEPNLANIIVWDIYLPQLRVIRLFQVVTQIHDAFICQQIRADV